LGYSARTIAVFFGHISGKGDTIPNPVDAGGSGEGAVCPKELDFLRTDSGGEYP